MYVLLCLGTSTTARDSKESDPTGLLRTFLFFMKPEKSQSVSMGIFGITSVVSHFFNAPSFATVSLRKLGPCGICQLATPQSFGEFLYNSFRLKLLCLCSPTPWGSQSTASLLQRPVPTLCQRLPEEKRSCTEPVSPRAQAHSFHDIQGSGFKKFRASYTCCRSLHLPIPNMLGSA